MSARFRILAAALFAIAVCAPAVAVAGAAARAGRVADEDASRIEQGKTLFHAKCGYCHLEGGTGTTMLGKRLGKDRALLEDRTDLRADYIKHVVRSGIGSMPRHNRIEVPDSELDLIAAYLTRPASARGAAK